VPGKHLPVFVFDNEHPVHGLASPLRSDKKQVWINRYAINSYAKEVPVVLHETYTFR
jgi:hypothetical protein